MNNNNLYLLTGVYSTHSTETPKQALAEVKLRVKYHGYEWSDVLGTSRLREVVDVRHLTQFYLYKCGLNYMQVARITNRNHATIIHAVKKCHTLLEVDKRFREVWGNFRLGQ